MKIVGYLKTSLIEWPGKISSVIFVPGCNFRCPFCHNADLADPGRIRRLTLIDEEQIFADLEKRKKWVDGVVVTGGEPTLQGDLSKFLSKLKKMGFLTMIETNGSKPEEIVKLSNCQIVNYFAVDIKGPFEEYKSFTGSKGDGEKVKESIKIILKSGVDCEFRTTVVPGLHDKEVLLEMASEIKELIENCKLKIENFKWFLQNFQPKNCLDSKFGKIKPYSKEKMEDFLKAVRKIIPRTELRGVS